jgi:hypothetical protein
MDVHVSLWKSCGKAVEKLWKTRAVTVENSAPVKISTGESEISTGFFHRPY